MNELLQKLLEAEVLSEETKKELEEAFSSQLDEAVAAAKDTAAAEVRIELTEQWVTEKENLIEAVDVKVTEYVEKEMEELKEDIEKFRDLEAEYAEKLVESKAAMADELKDDLKELVEKIDAFLEMRISSEMDELKEDLEEVRKNDFGRRVFEAFSQEFVTHYSDEESTEGQLHEALERIQDLEDSLEDTERKREKIERTVKMDEVLQPLTGRSREVMEAILKNVDTINLEEGYNTFIGRVLRETEEVKTDDSEKEDEVLAESEEKKGETLDEGVVVTGDTDDNLEKIDEAVDPQQKERLERIKALAGIK
jgi:hypothetical protein